jgi:hypothetical protein
MEVKLIKTEAFYNTMKYWWDGHKFLHVSPSMLPDTTFVCINNKGVPVYSTCFYNTDSNLCWIGWQISNPYESKEDKEGCFDFLVKEIENYAKSVGYHIVFTTSRTPKVEQTLLDNGFDTGDINVNHYIKTL